MMSHRSVVSSRTASIALALMIGALAPSAEAQLTAQQKADIGFTSLQSRLGAAMPTGANLSVRVVELPVSGNYGPSTNNAELAGKTFQFLSGTTGVNSHATSVSRFLFGSQSLAPAIGNAAQGQTAGFSAVGDWLNNGFLNVNDAGLLPAVETRKLVSHSWVGAFEDPANDVLAIDRADFAVQRDGTIATYALNNGSNTAIPSLMASTYNGIVVGRSDGGHSRGTTTISGTGRVKPDIVVPTNATSWATPTVSSAAGLLVETARVLPGLTDGDRPQVVKSLLMAGAVKSGDTVPGSWNWSNSQTQPLDSIYGAGQLNIENSYDILTAGRFAASGSALVGATGWDFGTTSSSAAGRYFFDVDAGGDLTASLNWQRTMSAVDTKPGQGVVYAFSGTLANLDLRLFSASGFTLGSLVNASLSTVDNTELIWATGLAPGRYALEVSSSTNNVNYGLAWTVVVPEPGTWALLAVAVAGGVAVRARRRAARAA